MKKSKVVKAWDSSLTIKENALARGITLSAAYSYRFRNKVGFRKDEVGPKIKPLFKEITKMKTDKIKWPSKLTHFEGCKKGLGTAGCTCGADYYNVCHDAFMEVVNRLHPDKRELDEKELSDFIYQAPLAHDLLAKAICLRFSAPRVEITKERIEHIIHRMTSWHSKDNYFFGIPYNKECPYCNDNLWLNNIAKAIKEELEKEK